MPILIALLLLVASAPPADATGIHGVRHHTDDTRTRVVLDLDGPLDYTIRAVESPERIVLDVSGARLYRDTTLQFTGSRVRRVRFNVLGSRAQVVLDMQGRYEFRSFTLPASGSKPPRIVVDILPGENAIPSSSVDSNSSVSTAKPTVASPPTSAAVADVVATVAPQLKAPRAGEPYVIVIDAGHGGQDPGTLGCGIVKEKTVALGIAQAIAEELRGSTDFKVVMTRKGDRTVGLLERVRIAKESQGDLFVSIHANSARSSKAHGPEVYFLSPRGATDQAARELANRENAAHMVGVEGASADDDIMSILMDLKGTAILQRSSQLAESALDQLDDVDGFQARFIKQARFAVLRTLAMPAILVEAGFLSNPQEARRLRKRSSQAALGRALAWAIIEYCSESGEKGDPVVARRVHRVRRGETLWDLAKLYNTSVQAISAANNLKGSRIRVGQELVLPR